MKISEITGTPEEIREFFEDKKEKEIKKEEFDISPYLESQRWSSSKEEFVAIKDMTPEHIINALKIDMKENTTKHLYNNGLFRCMIIGLAEKLKDDEKGYFDF